LPKSAKPQTAITTGARESETEKTFDVHVLEGDFNPSLRGGRG